MKVAAILLGGGRSERFGSPKLEAEIGGVRLVDLACEHFLAAGFEPVVFCGRSVPRDPRVLVAPPGPTMIETLRSGLAARSPGPFAFAPGDMPGLSPALLKSLLEAFRLCGKPYLVPVHGGRRGHPAFSARHEPFLAATEAREVWRGAGEDLVHYEVGTADVLFDVDTPEDLAAAGSESARRARLLARGDLRE